MADLTFDSQDIRTRGAIFFDIVSGYFDGLEARGVDVILPSVTGRVSFPRKGDRRVITLVGYVQGSTVSGWNSNSAALFAVMDPTNDAASLAVGAGYLGSSGKSITCRFLNATGGVPMNGPTFQTWVIQLESVDPDWT